MICKVCRDKAKRDEVNALLAAGEGHREIAKLVNVSRSAVGRHHREHFAVGSAPGGSDSRSTWQRILASAERMRDTIAAIRARKALDKLDADEKAAAKPQFSGLEAEASGLIASHKHSWRMCHQCRLLEILGVYRLPPASSEAFATKLCAELMDWAQAEAEQENPRTELVGYAGLLCAQLLGRPWPLEYREPVERLREATREAAVMFVAQLANLDNKEKQNEAVALDLRRR